MMKWWGWGAPDYIFDIEARPKLWPFIQTRLQAGDCLQTPCVGREQIVLRPPVVDEGFVQSLRGQLKPEQLKSDDDERLLHTYGKSYPDLLRVRRGQVTRAPDLVVLPERHGEVEYVVQTAKCHDVCIIPFGGGTNIVGAINPSDDGNRMVVSLDLRNMARLLNIDEASGTAVFEAGVLGPRLEDLLQERGWSLGHYPDSFEYSTLGGWLATRSAGMQSDAYGKIEDMVVALRMVTPAGSITTKAVPRASTGPDMNQLVVGSEGTLGVITEATMRIHANPPVRVYHGFLFPSFDDGVAAMHTCVREGTRPSLLRLSDAEETELSFHMKPAVSGLKALVPAIVKPYLAARGYTAPCLMIVGLEGTKAQVRKLRRNVFHILSAHRGFHLGKGAGDSWSQGKFNMPYLRDYLMDHGILVDVAETATLWSNVVPLYRITQRAFADHCRSLGIQSYMGCHISHTYETGACLYFTYAAVQDQSRALERYYELKRFITDTFLEFGAALSHHHAIGLEHRPWMTQEHSPAALGALCSLKSSLDPGNIMNPGKLLPAQVDKGS